MGYWQIQDEDHAGRPWAAGAVFDDGDTKRPGDAGFSLSAIIAYAAGRMFNFMGVPNWQGS